MRHRFDIGLAAGIGLLAVLIAANAVVSYRNTRQLNDDAAWVTHTHEVLAVLGGLRSDLGEMEADQRAYVLTGEGELLQAFEERKAALAARMNRAQSLTSDNPSQQAALAKLRSLIDTAVEELNRTAVIRKDQGFEPAHRTVATGATRKLLDEARGIAGQIETEERELLATRILATEQAYRTAITAVFIAMGGGLGAVGLFFWQLRRHLRVRAEDTAMIVEQRETLQATLISIGDGVIATDAQGRVTFLNAVAERLTGWTQAEAFGELLETVFAIVNETTRQIVLNPAHRALKEGRIVGLANHTILIAKDGTEWPLDDSAAPIRDEAGVVTGAVLVFREISEIKKAERELRETNERLRAIINQSAAGIAQTGLDGHFQFVNDRYCKIVDYPREELLGGMRMQDITHPDDLAGHPSLFKRAIDGSGAGIEKRYVRKGGVPVWVNNSVSALRDDAGRPVSILAVTLDVTERRRAEEQLAQVRAESERRKRLYETLLSTTPDFVYVFSLDYLTVYANQALLTMWGRTWDAAVGRTFLEIGYEPWHARMHEREIDEVRATKRPIRGEVPFNGTLGRRIYDYIFVPVLGPDGEVEAVAGTTRDVTDRKQTEDRLTRVAAAARSVNAVLTVESIARILAEEARVILGAGHAVADIAAGGGRPVSVIAGTTSDKNGSYATADLIGHGGQKLGYLRIGSSEGFNAADEAVLAQLAAIASVGIENARLYERLRDQDQRKDEFLATLAHELRNPLAPVRNGVQILRTGRVDGDRLDRTLSMMERQLGHMVHLVDDLMDLSRVSSGKVVLRREWVELRAIVESALETTRPIIEAGGHALDVRLPADPLVFDADRTRLSQVLANLLNNAAKYTPQGGKIELVAERDGGDAVIRVTDTGIGIPAEMLPRIFDMFTQVGASIERAQGGLGIGLTLVRRLVEMHGGHIEAQSTGVGQGSTFTFRLPLASVAAGGGPENAPDAAESATGSLRILIVDDNRDAAESLGMLLAMKQHETCTAHDGKEALAAAEAFRPDLVLLDIGLPGMNGYEVAKCLRQMPGFAGTKLVALTGWGQDEDRRRTRAVGFDHHMVKPADPAEVDKILADVIAAKR